MALRYDKNKWRRIEFLICEKDFDKVEEMRTNHKARTFAEILRYCIQHTHATERGKEKNASI